MFVLASGIVEAITLGTAGVIASIISSAVATLAIITGGLWAYLKFIRGRTFKPRLSVTAAGEWHAVGETSLLQARITLKNIGSSKVALNNDATYLQVSRLVVLDRKEPPDVVAWRYCGNFHVFTRRKWFEPGEEVSDDILLDLKTPEPIMTQLKVNIVCRRRSPWRWDELVFVRQVIPASTRAPALQMRW